MVVSSNQLKKPWSKSQVLTVITRPASCPAVLQYAVLPVLPVSAGFPYLA